MMQHDHAPHHARNYEGDGEEKDGESDEEGVEVLGDEVLTCEREIGQLPSPADQRITCSCFAKTWSLKRSR